MSTCTAYAHVCLYIQDVTHMHVCVRVSFNPKPLRVEAFWVSPAVIYEVQVVLRNGNKTAFLYRYSIDYSVLVASSSHPALSEHSC